MDLSTAVQELKTKYKNEESVLSDSIEMEKYFREFKTELYIKRDEVQQLKAELKNADSEIKQLKKELDVANKLSDENQFHFNIMYKKSKNVEEELTEKRNNLRKMQIQHNIKSSELETLKEKFQELETERNELTRKVEIFENKERYNTIYHNEILKRNNELKAMGDDINDMFAKLKLEQNENEMTKKTQDIKECVEKLQNLTDNYEKLKKEKDYMEELYIKTSAEYEKLKEYISMNRNIHEPSLLAKIIFSQWKNSTSQHEEDMVQINGLITNLGEALVREKNNNIQLINQNEELMKLNDNLKSGNEELLNEFRNLKQKCGNEEECIDQAVKVKNEPIEIDD